VSVQRFRVTTAPARRPVSVEQVKAHSRISGTTDDAYIGLLIDAAVDHCQELQARAYITQTVTLTLHGFPTTSYIDLPRAPLQSVSSVTYTPLGESSVVLSSAAYVVDTSTEPGRIVLADGYDWPTDELSEANGLVIVYLAGYGTRNATATITIASPGVVTWSAHGLLNGDPVVLTTTGALPTGLTAGTTYYVSSKTADTFQLAATSGGSAINTSGTQSGTHTATADGRPTSMPQTTIHALKLLVGHWYENREAIGDQSSGNMLVVPMAFQQLLAGNRVAVFC